MNKYKKLLGLLLVLFVFLSGCVTIGNEDSHETENKEIVEETDESDVEENEIDEPEEVDIDDELDGLAILEFDDVMLNLESVSDFNNYTFLEHDKVIYFSNKFVSDIIGLNINYDSSSKFSEVFEGKGDYVHKTVHADEKYSTLQVNEFWRYDTDDYWQNPNDTDYNYNFLEYDGELFIPERVVTMMGNTPVHRERQDNILFLGEKEHETSIVGVERNTSGLSKAAQLDSITHRGEGYGEGLELSFSGGSSASFQLVTFGEYSKMNIKVIPTEIKTVVGKEIDSSEIWLENETGQLYRNEVSVGEVYEIEVDISGSQNVLFFSEDKIDLYMTGYFK